MLTATSLAPFSTLTVPCTLVSLSVHDAACETRRLSTVVVPMVLRHTLSSASAAGAITARTSRPADATATILFSNTHSFLRLPTAPHRGHEIHETSSRSLAAASVDPRLQHR